MRARWLDAAAQCPWDMRTPKSWTAAGWVYVLRQPTDRWYRNRASKIGLTYRDPAVRAKELFTTALPRPLNVEFALFAPNMAKLECDVHARLARRLADETQEVFHVELRDAIRAVVETAEATGNTVGLYLVSPDAMRVAWDVLRRRARPTGVWTHRFIDTRHETLTPSVDQLRDLTAAHVAEARGRRARIRHLCLRAGLRCGGLAAGVALLVGGAAAMGLHASDPVRLGEGAALAGGIGLAAAALGFAWVLAAQTRRQAVAQTELAAVVRGALEDGATKNRRKPLEIQLMRFDSRMPRAADGTSV
jgi:hypothetical protein